MSVPKKGENKERKEGGTEVAVYDRALLEHHEVQPVATEDGHMICVNKLGRFTALLGEVEISEYTLEKARDKVHSTHLAQVIKKKKRTMAVPAFIYSPGGYKEDRFCGDGFFRGIHAGNGQIQWSKPDGTKGSSESAIVFHPDDPTVHLIRNAYHRGQEAQAIVKECEAITRPIRDAQVNRMYGDDLVRGSYRERPRVHNDAGKAQEVAEAIVANVLKEVLK